MSGTTPSAQPPKVGIVVPTLGHREQFLTECLRSLRSAGPCWITLVRPSGAPITDEAAQLVDAILDDPREGLAAAIDTGIRSLPSTVQLVGWLGDDDRLTPDALEVATEAITDGVAMVFGGCRYIDSNGSELWMNRSGQWAVPLMRCGPQLVPQPGSLFARWAYEAADGLDRRWSWAFDLDLFLRLGRQGRCVHLPVTLAEFRWHPDSLSVGGRRGSVDEASRIRVEHLPRVLRPVSVLWEPALRWLILQAGVRMSARMQAAATRAATPVVNDSVAGVDDGRATPQ